MSVFFTTFFICLIVGASVFFFVQYQIQLRKALGMERSAGVSLARKSFEHKAAQRGASNTQWKAVKVQPGLMCCQTAESMRGRIYLVAEAPDFPLKKCQSKECKCRYIHMNDRREGDDRRETTEFLIKMNNFQGQERRKTKDRRQVNL